MIGILTLGIYAAINRYRSLGKVPIDDLGIMWIVIFSLYSTLPAMFWIFQGGEYIPLNKRLFNLGTKPEDMIYLMNLSLVCLLFFIIGNKIFLKHHSLEIRSKEIDIPFSVVIAALLVILFNALINVFFGSFGLTQEASSYAESYVITQNLPLGLRQISKLLSGFDFISWIVMNIFFFKNYKKYRVYILLAALIFIILNLSGARSPIVFYLFTLLVLRHHFVRPLNLLPTLSLGIAGVVIFLGAGILRGLSGEFAIYGVGEFDMLGNAVELLHEKQSSGLEVPAG